MGIIERGIEKGLEALYPSNIYCISCGSIIDKTRDYALCDSCMEVFHWLGNKTCKKCGKILQEDYKHGLCYDCRAFDHDFDKGFTCVQYGLHERGVLMDYKYKGMSHIGRKLGDILYDRMALEEVDFDLVVPVPMYRKKQNKRGYNQAAIMALRFAQKCGKPCAQNLLRRRRETAPMKGLGAFERHENLKGALEVSPANHYKIKGRRFLVIDDIYTTGSTLDECSRILHEEGAEKVYVLTFACGPNRRPGEEIRGSRNRTPERESTGKA